MTFSRMFPRDADYDMADPATYLDEEDIGTQQAAQALAEQRHRAVVNDRALIDEGQSLGVVPDRAPLPMPMPATRAEPATPAPASGQIKITKLPEQEPEAAPKEKSFDWARAMAGLFEGSQGIANIDRGREGKARLAMEQSREKRAATADQRRAELDQFSLAEQKRRAAMLQQAADPQSDVSQRMREEMIMSFGVISESMPNLKPTIDGMMGKLGTMSARDMLELQDRMGKTFDMARKVAHDRATEKMAGARFDQGERQIQATMTDRAENRALRRDEIEDRRAEREEAKDEKALDAYGKEVEPINVQEALLNEVKNSNVTTGPIMARLQKVRQLFGIQDKDWDTTEGRIATARNEIRHALFGGALSPTEAAEFEKELPGMDTPRATFDAKIATTLEKLALKKQEAARRHPRAVKAKSKTQAPTQDQSKARAWLEKNPNHPLAPDVRKKLEGL